MQLRKGWNHGENGYAGEEHRADARRDVRLLRAGRGAGLRLGAARSGPYGGDRRQVGGALPHRDAGDGRVDPAVPRFRSDSGRSRTLRHHRLPARTGPQSPASPDAGDAGRLRAAPGLVQPRPRTDSGTGERPLGALVREHAAAQYSLCPDRRRERLRDVRSRQRTRSHRGPDGALARGGEGGAFLLLRAGDQLPHHALRTHRL